MDDRTQGTGGRARGAGGWREDPAPRRVAPGIGRYVDPSAEAPVGPSLALVREPAARERLSRRLGPRPRFGGAPGGWLVHIDEPRETDLYATGEVAGPLRRNGRRTTCWATDVIGYDEHSPALYQAHPWVLAVRPDGTSFGVLIDTSWRCDLDLSEGIGVQVHGPPCPVYVIRGDGPADVLRGLATLIGTAPLPPRWVLGYHQCRWSYASAERVREVADGFRERSLPCDAIWVDIDFMDGYRSFTFDRRRFPDPAGLCEGLRAHGFRSVWMVDPGIKVDATYEPYRSGRAGEHFVRDDRGEEYRGTVWPGQCAFPDFTRAATRRWWADLCAAFAEVGADGLWNDMNEPSVFDGPDRTMPLDCTHRADPELGGTDLHARYHNVYGTLMARATREGLARSRPGRRPFVLTRAAFLGGQRHAASWTGDNASRWDHLAWSIPMALNLGLSGQPLTGPDIGGFADDADGVLFARWMGIGCLLPFARGHSATGTADHEPWSFGADVEATCRRALERRYRLLPYLYSRIWDATRSGLPVVRPLLFADPADPALRGADDAFLLGDDLMARCRVRPDGDCEAAMPAGDWRPFAPLASDDPELPELWIRGGAVVPLGPVMQHSDERPLDPLTLVVALDDDGQAQGMLYEDAGDGPARREEDYGLVWYRVRRRGRAGGGHTLELEGVTVDGERARPARVIELVVVGPEGIEGAHTLVDAGGEAPWSARVGAPLD